MSAADLYAIAGWDVAALRGSAGTLGDVAERVGPWAVRVDGLAVALSAADCWSGPAGTVAAAALTELTRAAGGVHVALVAAGEQLLVVAGEADTARTAAETALAVAATGPVELAADGTLVGPPPAATAVPELDQVGVVEDRQRAADLAVRWARDALAAAGATHLAAVAVGTALAEVGVLAAVAPADLAGLVGAVDSHPVAAPRVPPPGDPTAAGAWWTGLTLVEQQAVVAADPEAIGGLDGVPAAARDEANRALLARALADPQADGSGTAVAVQDQLTRLAADGRTAQLVLFDPGEDLVALGVGDLDTAGAVGVLVPGMMTAPVGDLGAMTTDAVHVQDLAEAAAPGLAVATLVWMGYQTPGVGSFFLPVNARAAGPVLDRTLDGLAVARSGPAAAGGAPLPRTTLVAHSYGTVVAGEAARAEGELAADAVVVLGSPGMRVADASGLEADEVYGAWNIEDPVSWSGYYGPGPSTPFFGAVPLPTDPDQGHTSYYDPERPTLQAIAEVVAGTREPS
ncbi:hypothetical protein F1C76_13325 [Geodermatophilaceae bacterium NBWT11]|nr:hypothetical protein F1C76_13325 [Geodermatophilaceae bacterium NBWT11]